MTRNGKGFKNISYESVVSSWKAENIPALSGGRGMIASKNLDDPVIIKTFSGNMLEVDNVAGRTYTEATTSFGSATHAAEKISKTFRRALFGKHVQGDNVEIVEFAVPDFSEIQPYLDQIEKLSRITGFELSILVIPWR